jgi:hypothetical protein
MEFVLIAICVGSLRTLTKFPKNDFTYALNLGALTSRGMSATEMRTGELRRLIPMALSQGVPHTWLSWCGALLWGGASYASQGHHVTHDRVIGIVAPHCTILLDFICNPKELVRSGLHGRLLSVHYGPVPLLPRESSSNFVTAGADGATARGQCNVID